MKNKLYETDTNNGMSNYETNLSKPSNVYKDKKGKTGNKKRNAIIESNNKRIATLNSTTNTGLIVCFVTSTLGNGYFKAKEITTDKETHILMRRSRPKIKIGDFVNVDSSCGEVVNLLTEDDVNSMYIRQAPVKKVRVSEMYTSDLPVEDDGIVFEDNAEEGEEFCLEEI